jgi:hypothetical protein
MRRMRAPIRVQIAGGTPAGLVVVVGGGVQLEQGTDAPCWKVGLG